MIKNNLPHMLNEYGINQKDLAQAINVNKNIINRYINNSYSKIDEEVLNKLCKFFSCNTNDIFEYVDDVDYSNQLLSLLDGRINIFNNLYQLKELNQSNLQAYEDFGKSSILPILRNLSKICGIDDGYRGYISSTLKLMFEDKLFLLQDVVKLQQEDKLEEVYMFSVNNKE